MTDAEQLQDYDDWVERLTPHVRSKFEGMHQRITDLLRGWHEADARADALAAIVRELAERGPHIKELSIGVLCRTCPLKLPWDTWQRILTAESHEPDCIWRRAKVLYPEPGA